MRQSLAFASSHSAAWRSRNSNSRIVKLAPASYNSSLTQRSDRPAVADHQHRLQPHRAHVAAPGGHCRFAAGAEAEADEIHQVAGDGKAGETKGDKRSPFMPNGLGCCRYEARISGGTPGLVFAKAQRHQVAWTASGSSAYLCASHDDSVAGTSPTKP